MKTIDLGLFEGEPFSILTKHRENPEGREYIINFIPAYLEHKLMNEQADIIAKSREWKKIEGNDLERWKDILKKVIKENDEGYNEKDINTLRPMQLIGVLMALMTFLNQRSNIIYEALSDEAKEEVEKVKNEVKKKEIEKLL